MSLNCRRIPCHQLLALEKKRNNMTRRQEEKLRRLEGRIRGILRHIEENPDDGVLWLKRLIFAEQIRALKYIRPMKPTRIKGQTDPRALVAKRVSECFSARSQANIQEQIDWVSGLLIDVGGIKREGVNYQKARFLGTKIGRKRQRK